LTPCSSSHALCEEAAASKFDLAIVATTDLLMLPAWLRYPTPSSFAEKLLDRFRDLLLSSQMVVLVFAEEREREDE
jgi:hypothetical protein